MTDMIRYPYSGTVIEGFHNGRKFGFPTLNIALDPGIAFKETGVFAVSVIIGECCYYGMLYVGTRPTLSMKELSIEIHVFDFSSEIYGCRVQFSVRKKIRGDIKFDSVEQLISQIKKDQDEIRGFFGC